MATTPTADSPYRRIEAEYGAGTDALWEHLEKNKHEDISTAVGWALERAKRYFHRDQATIAEMSGLSKSFISALLSGRTKASPGTYTQIARAAEVSPLEFLLADGLIEPADIAAFSMPEKDVALPIIQKLLELPEFRRARAKAVVLSVLDSIAEVPVITETDQL